MQWQSLHFHFSHQQASLKKLHSKKVNLRLVFVIKEVSLALVRSDMMLESNNGENNEGCSCLKQVEVNTIASGFGWLGPICGYIHRLASVKLCFSQLSCYVVFCAK